MKGGKMRSTLLALLCGAACAFAAEKGPPYAHRGRAPGTQAGADAGGKLQLYLDGVSKKLGDRVLGALGSIDGTARRLLAVRAYLRSEGVLGSRWSWSAEEIERYKGSDEYRQATAEVEKVRKKFEELNPGYTLHVNTEVRSLDAQIKNWNETKSVQLAAEDLLAAALKEISAPAYKDPPDQAGLARFQRFLKNHKPAQQPTVAAPGLSPHGRLRAFDFQIKQGDKVVAGTEAATIKEVWDGQGWAQKLKAAVTSAGAKFTGPLSSPREPWHYTYNP